MNTYATALLDKLPTPIAVISQSGEVEYRNKAFQDIFGSDAKSWLKDASRVVAGERGWVQGFFLPDEEQQTIDVEIEGRIYRIDKIMNVETEGAFAAVALSFVDVTQQREAEQAKSDFPGPIGHDP